MSHNRSNALERSVKKLLGGLNRFYGYPTSPSASIMAQNIQLFGPREGFLTHQWIITWNKYITDNYYDEAKMRTRQKRVATDTWRSLGCRTTPLEHWSKRKPTVEPCSPSAFVPSLICSISLKHQHVWVHLILTFEKCGNRRRSGLYLIPRSRNWYCWTLCFNSFHVPCMLLFL